MVHHVWTGKWILYFASADMMTQYDTNLTNDEAIQDKLSTCEAAEVIFLEFSLIPGHLVSPVFFT